MTDTQAHAAESNIPRLSAILTPVGRWWTTLDRVQRGFVLLLGLRVVIALVFMLNILPLDLRFRWFLHHGGDQDDMVALAISILKGKPEPAFVGIGQALVMIPFLELLNTGNYFKIVAPLVVINGFIMGGLSVPVTGGIARRVTGDDRTALWAAGLWAVLPLLTYFAFFWHFDPVILRSSNVPKVGWLNGLSDGPATFFLMVAVVLLAAGLNQEERPPFWRMVGVGAALSAAVMYRVHIAPMVAFLLLYVLIAHGWRSLLIVCVAGLVTYIPQGWYNWVVFKNPITTGYLATFTIRAWGGPLQRPILDVLRSTPYHPRHVIELLAYFLGPRPWLIAPLTLALAAGTYVLVVLWKRRGWRAVALLIAAPMAYVGSMATAWPFREDVIRFLLPAAPYFVIMAVYAAWSAWGMLKRTPEHETG
jgi:hypothetical protein